MAVQQNMGNQGIPGAVPGGTEIPDVDLIVPDIAALTADESMDYDEDFGPDEGQVTQSVDEDLDISQLDPDELAETVRENPQYVPIVVRELTRQNTDLTLAISELRQQLAVQQANQQQGQYPGQPQPYAPAPQQYAQPSPLQYMGAQQPQYPQQQAPRSAAQAGSLQEALELQRQEIIAAVAPQLQQMQQGYQDIQMQMALRDHQTMKDRLQVERPETRNPLVWARIEAAMRQNGILDPKVAYFGVVRAGQEERKAATTLQQRTQKRTTAPPLGKPTRGRTEGNTLPRMSRAESKTHSRRWLQNLVRRDPKALSTEHE